MPKPKKSKAAATKKNGLLAQRKAAKINKLRAEQLKPLLQQARVFHQQGQFGPAASLYQQILSLDPAYTEASLLYAEVLFKTGQLAASAECLRQVLQYEPRHAQAMFLLGVLAQHEQAPQQAIEWFKKAISVKSDFIEAYNNLGVTLKGCHAYEEAIACFEQVRQVAPTQPFVLANLGECLKETGRMQEAVDYLRQAVAHQPDFAAAWSNLLLAQNYLDAVTPAQHLADHQSWISHCPIPLAEKQFDFSQRAPKKKRLRIGYVSPDLHTHSVSYFIEPLWRHHDKSRFEVYAYYSGRKHDLTNQRLRSLVDVWRDVPNASDQALARQIYCDEIDLLVDLSGHMADHRLAVFARKPAPVQLSWLGYPNTTGLQEMDWRISDAVADPSPESDRYHSEKLLRLPGGFLCYAGNPSIAANAVAPRQRKGYFTFGSFNNLVKVQAPVIALWARILRALPQSKLLLKSLQLRGELAKQHCIEAFAEQGISPERLLLYGMLPDPEAHLKLYDEVDLALDPFPYNGTTTTCEAAWMGVPTLTLRGRTHACRVGASINTRLGLHHLITDDVEAYFQHAVACANDPDCLTELRGQLRATLQNSSLGDAPRFATEFEAACEQAWQAWAAQRLEAESLGSE